MKQVNAIAIALVRQVFRSNGFTILSFSSLILLVSGFILGDMAVGGRSRVFINSGFWVLGMWGLITAIYLNGDGIHNETKNKTIYTILSKNISRNTFLIGKFVGYLYIAILLFGILSIMYMVQLQLVGIEFHTGYWIALLFIFMEWILLASLSLMFSTFTSQILSAFFLTGIYYMGHWSRSFYIIAQNSESALMQKVVLLFYYGIPNLEAINFRAAALNNETIVPTVILKGGAVAIGWTLTALFVASIVFKGKRL